jgi:hypothetical protein
MLLPLMATGAHSTMTVTLQGNDLPLGKVLDNLVSAWGRLRRTSLFNFHVAAGASFIEITRGSAGDHWHVHAHAICRASYIEWEKLREAWRGASGGSHVVNIRAVGNKGDGAFYAAKYATKGYDESVWRDPSCLVEAVKQLSGRRLLSTFGAWWGARPPDDERPEMQWEYLWSLEHVVTSAAAGEMWAIGLLSGAPGSNRGKPLELERKSAEHPEVV